jgi:uncharacterized ParB-like nuclease family protein
MILDTSQSTSLEIFNAARRRALIQSLLAEVSGRRDDLLSFEQVREQLRLSEPGRDVTLQAIPLDKIVGSVGRYRDFNRAFLPKAQIDPDRWTRIERLSDQGALPPVEVFKVGEVYFVCDGNHRVSTARARGRNSIRAKVVEIPIRVPLGPNTSPDDLILKSGYAQFLERTGLDQSHPQQRIELTRAGGYRSLLQHIEVHQYYMGLRSRHYPTLAEAAADWYSEVYSPVVERIRSSRILSQFPGRTEADLYLWIAKNRARLQMRYGGHTEVEEAVDDFAHQHHVPAVLGWTRRLLHRVFPRFLPPEPKSPPQLAPSRPPEEEPLSPQPGREPRDE